MSYGGPKPVPPEIKDLGDALAYAHRELVEVAREAETVTVLNLVAQHEEPKKPRNGMIVFAGSGWNPGDGVGFYGRYGDAWHKLG